MFMYIQVESLECEREESEKLFSSLRAEVMNARQESSQLSHQLANSTHLQQQLDRYSYKSWLYLAYICLGQFKYLFFYFILINKEYLTFSILQGARIGAVNWRGGGETTGGNNRTGGRAGHLPHQRGWTPCLHPETVQQECGNTESVLCSTVQGKWTPTQWCEWLNSCSL